MDGTFGAIFVLTKPLRGACPINTFGARGLEEFFEGLFSKFLVGFESSFSQFEPQLEIQKKKDLQKTLSEPAEWSKGRLGQEYIFL